MSFSNATDLMLALLSATMVSTTAGEVGTLLLADNIQGVAIRQFAAASVDVRLDNGFQFNLPVNALADILNFSATSNATLAQLVELQLQGVDVPVPNDLQVIDVSLVRLADEFSSCRAAGFNDTDGSFFGSNIVIITITLSDGSIVNVDSLDLALSFVLQLDDELVYDLASIVTNNTVASASACSADSALTDAFVGGGSSDSGSSTDNAEELARALALGNASSADETLLLAQIDCAFWEAERNRWISDGCFPSHFVRLLPENATGVYCECSHLTEFSILVRRDQLSSRALGLCSGAEQREGGGVQYLILAILYGCVMCVTMVQLQRIVKSVGCRERYWVSLMQHALLLAISITRCINMIVYWEFLEVLSFSSLVLITSLPHVFSISAFGLVIGVWYAAHVNIVKKHQQQQQKLETATMTKAKEADSTSSFFTYGNLRLRFLVVNTVCITPVLLVFVLLAVVRKDSMRFSLAVAGAYSVAVTSFALALGFATLSLWLRCSRRVLEPSPYMVRLSRISLILCFGFVASSILLVLSVSDVPWHDDNFNAFSTLYYVLDLVCMASLLALFWPLVLRIWKRYLNKQRSTIVPARRGATPRRVNHNEALAKALNMQKLPNGNWNYGMLVKGAGMLPNSSSCDNAALSRSPEIGGTASAAVAAVASARNKSPLLQSSVIDELSSKISRIPQRITATMTRTKSAFSIKRGGRKRPRSKAAAAKARRASASSSSSRGKSSNLLSSPRIGGGSAGAGNRHGVDSKSRSRESDEFERGSLSELSRLRSSNDENKLVGRSANDSSYTGMLGRLPVFDKPIDVHDIVSSSESASPHSSSSSSSDYEFKFNNKYEPLPSIGSKIVFHLGGNSGSGSSNLQQSRSLFGGGRSISALSQQSDSSSIPSVIRFEARPRLLPLASRRTLTLNGDAAPVAATTAAVVPMKAKAGRLIIKTKNITAV
jgi:hypothetical protein